MYVLEKIERSFYSAGPRSRSYESNVGLAKERAVFRRSAREPSRHIDRDLEIGGMR